MVGLTAVFVLYTGAAILFCGNSEWWGWREISFFFSREILQPWPGIICFVLLFPVVLMATAVAWALLSRRQRLAFLRRQSAWPKLKPWLLFVSILLGWVALFYLEENWRGQRAWEQYRHELEAAGEHLDFAAFIPPPVPDDQNFAMSPIWSVCNQTIKSPPKEEAGDSYSPANTNPVNPLLMTIERNGVLFPAPPGNTAKVPFPSGAYFITTNLSPDTTNANGQYQPPTTGRWMEAKLTNLKAWQFFYRLPQDTNRPYVPRTNEFTLPDQLQSPAADVLQALSKYAGPLEELRQASERPYSRFPLNYEAKSPNSIRVPHWRPLKECAQVLSFRAVAELYDRQTNQALADIKLILYLAGSVKNEPVSETMQVRRGIIDTVIQPIWEGLAQRLWSDDQLKQFDQELAAYDALYDYDQGLRRELALQLKEIEYLKNNRANGMTDMNGDTVWLPTLAYWLSPGGWFYEGERKVARVFNAALPTPYERDHRMLSRRIPRRVGDIEAEERRSKWNPSNLALAFTTPTYGQALHILAQTQASVDMARIGCALERYRQTHGNYPETLDALVPEFMVAIPHDIINGQPLHYRRTTNGLFILYSVGWDEKDDGGVPAPRYDFLNRVPGDWVWQYPGVPSPPTGN